MNESADNPEQRIRIVGVGNVLRSDDGLGVHALRMLQRESWPPSVEFVDAGSGGGWTVLEALADASHVCLIDAMRLGNPPGTVYHFPRRALEFPVAAAQVSLHGFGLSAVLALGEKLDLQPELYLVGVEPRSLEFGEGLSPTVHARLPEVVAVVRRTEADWLGETTDPPAQRLAPAGGGDRRREGSGAHGEEDSDC